MTPWTGSPNRSPHSCRRRSGLLRQQLVDEPRRTEHGTLVFAGGIPLVIADWEVTENAPDRDGRIYASVRGWLVNGAGTRAGTATFNLIPPRRGQRRT